MKQEIQFVRDIPGFSGYSKFSCETAEEQEPFAMLQCLDNEDIGFIVANPFSFFPQYQIDLPNEVIMDLEILRPEDVQVWGVITYRSSLVQSTINLQAPVIINTRNWKAIQVVLNHSENLIRQPLLPIAQTDGLNPSGSLDINQLQGGNRDVSVNSQEGGVNTNRR
ncbi:flagellar assembly protein FliW [Paenibacillus sp. GCM10027628]|uniref:flagellar assembly protein FliW n=1 Tax=Paenibacillus sp. GCM10027628 TaxID=3273413 RepID=UPI00363965B6